MESREDINVSPDSFDSWLNSRPQWLQTAAKRLVENKRFPTAEEIKLLSELCINEVLEINKDSFDPIKPGMLQQAANSQSLRLTSINEVRGINAIKNDATLNFGSKNLTVIYGSNGSGKSGYSRLLKEICGSRAKEALYPNIFQTNNPSTHAKINFKYNESDKELIWNVDSGPVQLLRNIHVFDSKAALIYMGEKNEATYEPSRMRFISSLIKVCDEVSSCISERQRTLVKVMPNIPTELSESPAAKWLATLAPKTKITLIDTECLYTPDFDMERITGEAALAEKDIVGRLKSIVRDRAIITQIKNRIESIKIKLSDTTLAQLVSSRNDALEKRKIASEDARKVFSNISLEGIGEQTWRDLWEHARKYSESLAYKNIKFPNTENDSLCVLCQQELSPTAKQRLQNFESFIIGQLEKTAKQAELKYSELSKLLPMLPQINDWIADMSFVKIEESESRKLHAALTHRKLLAESATLYSDIPQLDLSSVDSCIVKAIEKLNAEEKTLTELQMDDQRKILESRVLKLKGIQWLSQNKESIIKEHQRLTSYSILTKALTLTKTNTLTSKKNELSVEELNAGYLERFSKELKELGGARLPVKAESSTKGKGKIVFGLALNGSDNLIPVNGILSEGEARIVALSAFLADMTGLNQSSPFIFDDPISSLDQDFEEKVVSRLISLSLDRQVIIFTHRLSLLTQIESGVKKLQEQAKLEKTNPPIELHIETLRRLGASSGLTVPMNIRNSKPKAALNQLLNESIKRLRKLYEQSEVEDYDHLSKGICSDFRIVMERCVESILLNDVLQRFRRDIQTKNRIGSLAKIQTEDCLLFDDLITRYSVFEHSQSEELPAQSVELEELEVDVQNLLTWLENFEKRAVS
ncbi:AAA family ATPase [Pectobacterium brasiliense]|uniref:AAA family ATPase n=1 Tax=Pectobacterium brasiliense TaxID=180957 RepID=UPI0030D22557